jgi:hypothetical protein
MYATSCATADSMCHEPRVPRQHQLPIHRVYSTAKMEALGLLTGLDARSCHAAPLTAVGCLCIAPIGTTRAAQPARGRYSIRGEVRQLSASEGKADVPLRKRMDLLKQAANAAFLWRLCENVVGSMKHVMIPAL